MLRNPEEGQQPSCLKGWLTQAVSAAVGLVALGAIFAVPMSASAETIEDSCQADMESCGEIRVYNNSWVAYSDIYLEGSRTALLTDSSRCNSIDYRIKKDLLKDEVHTFKVPAPCHYTLIVNVSGAIGKASTKSRTFSLTQECEVKIIGTGTLYDSHLEFFTNKEDAGCEST